MVRRYMLIMILLIHGRYIYNLDAHINDGRDDFVFPSLISHYYGILCI